MKDVWFQSWEQLVAGIARMREEGWSLVPADSPEEGLRAFRADREGEEPVLLGWLPWRRRLTAKVTVCSTWEEFVSELELRKLEDMEKCDDVPASMVGFAAYGRAESAGLCEVLRIPVAELQRGGAEARKRLIAILMASKHPGAAALRGVREPEPSSEG